METKRENLYDIVRSNKDVAKLCSDNKIKMTKAQRIRDLILDHWSTFTPEKKANIGPVLERLVRQIELGN